MSPYRNRAYREKHHIRVAAEPREQAYLDELPWLANYVPLNRGIWSERIKINKADLDVLYMKPRDTAWKARIYLADCEGFSLIDVRRAWFALNDENVRVALNHLGSLADRVKYVIKVTYHDTMAGLQVWRFPADVPAPEVIRQWTEQRIREQEEAQRRLLAEHDARTRQEVATARADVSKVLAEE